MGEVDAGWNATGKVVRAVKAMTRAMEATAGLLLWVSPPRGSPRIPVDRDAFRTVVVVGFGVGMIFIVVWLGRWRWQ